VVGATSSEGFLAYSYDALCCRFGLHYYYDGHVLIFTFIRELNAGDAEV